MTPQPGEHHTTDLDALVEEIRHAVLTKQYEIIEKYQRDQAFHMRIWTYGFLGWVGLITLFAGLHWVLWSH